MFGSLGMPEVLVIIAIAVGVVWPVSRICAKAGYSLLWFLALAEWPRKNQPPA
ncbi:MAG: hypothetical protein JO093_05765 [Acidobacteria bacterium]|nr:hypothetical protein [Acidobacteriota bacterium]MBV9185105.1 hypothetical protein [Acidobacteriota bacterium]